MTRERDDYFGRLHDVRTDNTKVNVLLLEQNESLKKQLSILEGYLKFEKSRNARLNDEIDKLCFPIKDDLRRLSEYILKTYHHDLIESELQKLRLMANSELRKQIEELKGQCQSDYKENRAIREDLIVANETIKELKAENEKLKSNQLRGFEKQWSKETTTEATNETQQAN